MIKNNAPRYLHKPSKEDFKKALDCMKEIHSIIKKKKISYIPSEKMADLLKDQIPQAWMYLYAFSLDISYLLYFLLRNIISVRTTTEILGV